MRKENFYLLICYIGKHVSIPLYGPHYADKPPKVSGDEWEAETYQILKKVFPGRDIQSQVKFDFLPHAIIDFYVPSAKIAIECKACGLTPVPRKCDDSCCNCDITGKCALYKNETRQNILKKHGIAYIWWASRERASLVPRTRKHLQHALYDCLGERTTLEKLLTELSKSESRDLK